MKTYDEVWKLIITIFLDQFRLLENQLVPEAKLKDDLDLDSLDLLDFLCEVETKLDKTLIKFNIPLSKKDEKNQKLINDWYKVINGTLGDLCKFLLKTINELEEPKNESNVS